MKPVFNLRSCHLMCRAMIIDVVNGIYNVTTLFPSIGFVLPACALIFLYPLSKKKVLSNVAELTARKAK